jgi:15-cis-phytoene synthase
MPATPEPGSPRYFALLYSPEPQRQTLDSLFGIEREVSESLRPDQDHQVAHSRLQWWREECNRTAGGSPVHPLTRTLADSMRDSRSGLVDVAVWDLAGATFETRRELTAYCGRWAAAMFPDSQVLHALGTALRELELLSDLAREAHCGRIRVPLDELQNIQANPGTLAKPPWPVSVAQLLRTRHKNLRDELACAVAKIAREQQPAWRGFLVWAALAARNSRKIELALPGRPGPGRLDALADAWSAWGVARKANVGRFQWEH